MECPRPDPASAAGILIDLWLNGLEPSLLRFRHLDDDLKRRQDFVDHYKCHAPRKAEVSQRRQPRVQGEA